MLTPEDGFEKNLLSSFGTKKLTAKVEMGSFYKCMGGWTREGSEDSSLIVRFVE